MCIITMIDTSPHILDIRDIKTITIANSLLGNIDGFGYYLFKDKLVKSKEEALVYWRENWDKFVKENNEDFRGIYHVRKSSVNYNYAKDNNHIADDKSHPFEYNNIIVAHNGFFNFRYTHIDADKYEKELFGNLIDSQKFAIVLSKMCTKGKVTFENIKDALNIFGGAYALAIKGKKDNFAWLVRGKDRTLFEMSIFDGENVVGKIINTSSFSQILIGENLLDYGLDYDIKELKENTAYKYNLGSYELEEVGIILQDSTFISKPKSYSTHTSTHTPATHVNVERTTYEDMLTLMYSLGLIVSDLVIISEIIFNKPFFTLDKQEFEGFKFILEKLKNEALHGGRLQIWQEIIKERKESIYKLYTGNKIQYPYFMNTKNELKDLYRKSKREKSANGLFAVQ